jgi:hypothetical protein
MGLDWKLILNFKNERIFKNFTSKPMHPRLTELLLYFFRKHYELVVTSYYRPNSAGVHSTIPVRGCDLRSFIFPYPEDLVESANKDWVYDPKRPELKCFIYHDVGKGEHFHLQAHNNTRYIGGTP